MLKAIDLADYSSWIVKGLVFALVVNAIVLDVFFFLKKPVQTESVVQKQISSAQISQTPLADQACPTACVAQINQVSASLKTSPQTVLQTVTSPTVKDTFIPLGSGSSMAADWTTVPGVQAYVDPSKYGKIKTVVFEASVAVPNAQQDVSVRLFNYNDQRPVWNSEVKLPSSNTSGMIISNPITIDNGNKLYQVQMKTQLQAPANLVQARIHITSY